MAEVDYKSLFDKVKAFLQSKYQYSKLTLAEILSILLARIAICVVAFLCATEVLLYLSQALVNVLIASFNDVAMAYLAVAGLWLVLCLLLFAFKTPLIINPITKFVTKLMFNPDDETEK